MDECVCVTLHQSDGDFEAERTVHAIHFYILSMNRCSQLTAFQATISLACRRKQHTFILQEYIGAVDQINYNSLEKCLVELTFFRSVFAVIFPKIILGECLKSLVQSGVPHFIA